MQVSVISKHSYALRDVITVSDYEAAQDSEYDGKSQVTVHRKPVAEKEDFIILRDGKKQWQGIVSNIENAEDEAHYTITVVEMTKLFYQKVILANEALLKTGIEDFIADQITGNFIENPDGIVNISYLDVIVKTHTPVAAKVPAENGIFNLCTYIGNALTNYGVFIDFIFTPGHLEVTLEKRDTGVLEIDTGVSDITGLSETYEVRALSKLTVIWRQEIPDGNGIGASGADESTRQFFLRTDRTITEDVDDPDRAKGTADIIMVQAETEAAMVQEARNQFASNAYQHKISFRLSASSKLVRAEDLCIGRACRVKTKNGIKDSIISGLAYSSRSHAIDITLGKLKVGLIEKLKGVGRQ